jgi:succinoglycan biosynthesis transport protein ExoP
VTASPLPEELPAVFWLEHVSTLARNWKPLVFAVAASALAALLVSVLQPRIYHAHTTLEVEGITDNLLRAQDGNPNSGSDLEVLDIQTQIRVMQSASLIARARTRLGRVDPQALQMAENTLVVRLAGPTRIIEVDADSTNSAVAAAFVNALGDEAILQHIDARWEGTQRSAEKLKVALQDMRAKLERSQNALQDYARQSGLIVTADNSSPTDQKLTEIQSELSRAQADRIAKESRWESVAPYAGLELIPILHDPVLSGAEEKLNGLRRQMAELSATYTPGYQKVQRLAAQIEVLETEVLTDIAGSRQRLHSEYAESQRRQDLLVDDYQAQARRVSSEAARRVHYEVLKSEVDSTRALYDTMFSRVKQATIASAMRGSNMRVLDPAFPAAAPYRPRIGQSVLLGSLAGAFFGFVFVLGWAKTNPTIQGPGDSQLLFDVPEYGWVPSIRFAHEGDSCHAILASFLFSIPPGASKLILVTSPNQGDGKTTVIINLARSLARVGRRTLLIDGDFLHPQLHQLLALSPSAGLADLVCSATAACSPPGCPD